jgi:L-threonylcarbamoyladenylate synthase
METRILLADDAGIALAADLLRQGSLVAFPTETVYGLGGRADRLESIQAIFSAKGRPSTDPLILHWPEPDLTAAVAEGWVADPLPKSAVLLATTFWPGPLTLILHRGGKVHPEMTAGRDTVAVRCPAHPAARRLLQRVDAPLAAPSANRFGRISPTDAAAVRDELGGSIPLILDGGPCSIGLESTVLNLTGQNPEILRPGAITADQLAQVLGLQPDTPHDVQETTQAQLAPGQLASHYAPQTPLFLSLQPIRNFLPSTFHLLFATPPGKIPEMAAVLDAGKNQEKVARELYRALRAADASGSEKILVEPVPDGPWAAALRDRLTRASSGTASWDGHSWLFHKRGRSSFS